MIVTSTRIHLHLLAIMNEAEIKHPSVSFRLRMRGEIFRYLAEENYQTHKKTKNFHYAGMPVVLDSSIPKTKEGEDFTSNIFVEEAT